MIFKITDKKIFHQIFQANNDTEFYNCICDAVVDYKLLEKWIMRGESCLQFKLQIQVRSGDDKFANRFYTGLNDSCWIDDVGIDRINQIYAALQKMYEIDMQMTMLAARMSSML
jgi:hypothetical protein